MTETGFIRFVRSCVESVAWLREIGMVTDTSRFAQYIEALVAETSPGSTPAMSNYEAFATNIAALEAGHKLNLIRRELESYSDQRVFREKLSRFCTGPLIEALERPGNPSTHARDYGFELVFGAHMARAGFRPEFPNSGDLAFPTSSLNIECKRVQGYGGVASAYKKARRKLRARARNLSARPSGIVALNLGKLLHAGHKILSAPNVELANERLAGDGRELVTRHDNIWQRKPDKYVQAVVVYTSAMVSIADANAWIWCYHMTINPVRPSVRGADDAMLNELKGGLETLIGYTAE